MIAFPSSAFLFSFLLQRVAYLEKAVHSAKAACTETRTVIGLSGRGRGRGKGESKGESKGEGDLEFDYLEELTIKRDIARTYVITLVILII